MRQAGWRVRPRLKAGLRLFITLLGVAACSEGIAPPSAQSPPAARAERSTLELGREVYNSRCYFCHGYSGDAKTLAASYLRPPPRDFTSAAALSAASIVETVRNGRAGTAMQPFRGVLSDTEQNAVAAFVIREFVQNKRPNTAYHTASNGWPDHRRYAAAFPFVSGAMMLDTPDGALDAEQRRGRGLFMSACVSCHDRAPGADESPVWSSRPLSYPRMGVAPGHTPQVDPASSANLHAQHDVAPRLAGPSLRERRGEQLFQANCAFCHAADGTGKNWIGLFLQPKARDLTAFTPQSLPPARLRQVIRDGLPSSSMPAWRDVLQPAEIDAIATYVERVFVRREAR
jgi:cytochrome c oxidase cbb3-type subunit 3